MMKIEKLPRWCQEADEGLSETFDRDHDELVRLVNAGQLELFRLWDGAAYMVTRTDRRLLRITGNLHEPAHGERHQMRCKKLAVRPSLTETGDRGDNQPRIAL